MASRYQLPTPSSTDNEKASIAAWQTASTKSASRAALDNINRSILLHATTAPHRQRTPQSQKQAESPAKSFNRQGFRQNSEIVARNFGSAPSVASLEQQFFDAKSNIAPTVQEDDRSDVETTVSVAPHLRGKVKPSYASILSSKKENNKPTNAELKAEIGYPSSVQSTRTFESDPSSGYKSNYAKFLAAQTNYQPPTPVQSKPSELSVADSEDVSVASMSTIPKLMNSGIAAKSASKQAHFPCRYVLDRLPSTFLD